MFGYLATITIPAGLQAEGIAQDVLDAVGPAVPFIVTVVVTLAVAGIILGLVTRPAHRALNPM